MRTRRHLAVALLLATGACTGDDGAAGADADGAVADAATVENADLEAALEFAQCMRDHGIQDFEDPQIRADGDFSLSPPADVGDEQLKAADEVCQSLLPWRARDPGTTSNTDQVAAGWERIVPDGNCRCSDGSEFSFWVREANPDEFLIYLQDGGACFSAETCAPGSDHYRTTVEGPSGVGGIFDFADGRNPFAEHSVVYVPYCTGDVHLGNTTTEYAPGLVVHHNGYINGLAALDHMVATAERATDVVVVGESAGAIAAPLYAGLVSDRLPDARITVLADGSGSYPDAPRVDEILAAWGFGNTIPAWPDSSGRTAERWSIPGLFIHSGRHDPDIVFARHDYAYDEQQQRQQAIAGIPATDLLSRIDANETHIEAAGVNILSYIAPGDEHTALSDGTFYTEQVNKQPLADWVAKLIAGEPVDDVHCDDCRAR